ncbi:hypothetical protein TRFO_22277 [Tritrichomonas foetus]|uniref:Uncharacterized protein n=1 Tax=Tritrichomonas foetus TaxID=1144522 RepID=A0A1J4KC09_9EUKA|nr:hypothetical protein TRFO_22277 [Tritrichomonas foetus]|eukprot:OHT08951.1 hypothetical protein TRFO_22277 [Tritrichomonas foetus]
MSNENKKLHIINHKYEGGITYYQEFNSNSRDCRTVWKTIDQVDEKLIIDYYKSRIEERKQRILYLHKSNSIIDDEIPINPTVSLLNVLNCNLGADQNVIKSNLIENDDYPGIKEDLEFFNSLSSNPLPPINIDEAEPIEVPFEQQLMIPCDDDTIFICPKSIKKDF